MPVLFERAQPGANCHSLGCSTLNPMSSDKPSKGGSPRVRTQTAIRRGKWGDAEVVRCARMLG